MKRLYFALKKYLFDLLSGLQASTIVPIKFRPYLWRFFGIDVGDATYLGAGWHILNRNLTIGDFCVLGYGGYFDCTGSIEIGERVHIGAKSVILSASHKIMPSVYRRDRDQIYLFTTKIGRGCWIGTGVTILPGVSVGEGCVIGSGAVVHSDCVSNGLYVGIPARRIRDLPVQ